MGSDLGAEVGAVFLEFGFRQSFRSAHQITMNAAALPALASAVLHGLHLHVVPVLPKRRENAAMMRHVAVPVGSALPDAHGSEMRRLQRSYVPLIDAVIGDTVEADLAVRPWLPARPFDAIVEIFCLSWREVVDKSGGASGAA